MKPEHYEGAVLRGAGSEPKRNAFKTGADNPRVKVNKKINDLTGAVRFFCWTSMILWVFVIVFGLHYLAAQQDIHLAADAVNIEKGQMSRDQTTMDGARAMLDNVNGQIKQQALIITQLSHDAEKLQGQLTDCHAKDTARQAMFNICLGEYTDDQHTIMTLWQAAKDH